MITFLVRLTGFILGLVWFGPWFLVVAILMTMKITSEGELI